VKQPAAPYGTNLPAPLLRTTCAVTTRCTAERPPGRHCEARGDSHRRSNLARQALWFPGGSAIPPPCHCEVSRASDLRSNLVRKALRIPRAKGSVVFPGGVSIPRDGFAFARHDVERGEATASALRDGNQVGGMGNKRVRTHGGRGSKIVTNY